MFVIMVGCKFHGDSDETIGYVKTEVEAKQIVDRLNKENSAALKEFNYRFFFYGVKRFTQSNAKKALRNACGE